MKTKILIALLALASVFCFAFGISGCLSDNDNKGDDSAQSQTGGDNTDGNSGSDNTDVSPDGSSGGKLTEYTIFTQSIGGADVNGVKVSLSLNGTVKASQTSNYGYVRFNIPQNDYDISYELPEGYFADPEYTAAKLLKDCEDLTVKFNSSVIDSTADASITYETGDVMHNFSVTDADGETMELKTLLQTYKLVVLNFWYINCGPCKLEFPAMQRTYETYKDKVAIVSLSTLDGPQNVKEFKEKNSYTFFMASAPSDVKNKFKGSPPINVFIDRYGVVDAIETGMKTEDSFWSETYEHYISDGYGAVSAANVKTVLNAEIDFGKILPLKFI